MFELITARLHIDFAPRHRQPSVLRVVLATLVAIAGSLAADAILVAAGEALFPATVGYAHFQFADYAKLTVIGVIIAGVAWPIMTRVTTIPRVLFAWAAVAVTLVLLLPDVYLLFVGQRGDAVGVLVAMHFAIAVVTYAALVAVAPIGADDERAADRPVRQFAP